MLSQLRLLEHAMRVKDRGTPRQLVWSELTSGTQQNAARTIIASLYDTKCVRKFQGLMRQKIYFESKLHVKSFSP